jgi:SAM-dependent methyltransferase
VSWDSTWETVYRSRAWGRYPGEDVVRFVMRSHGAAADRAKVRLLEVGCGSGANLWFMAREGFGAYGIEAAPTAVRLCNERLDRECPQWRKAGGRVEVGDIGTLPYPDGYFDAVLDVVAICYSPFPAAQSAYRELARVTKPGGQLFSRTFAKGCWGDGTGIRADHDMWVCFGATRFTDPARVPQLVQGWRVERVERSTVTEDDGLHEISHLLIYGVKE